MAAEDFAESRSTAMLHSNITDSPEKIMEKDNECTTPKRKVLVSKKNKHAISRESSINSKTGSNKVEPKDSQLAIYTSKNG